MNLEISDLEKWIREDLKSKKYYTRQSWCKPRKGRSNRKVYDVAIIGAGQCGLTLAHNLKLKGIGRIVIFDKQPKDRPGPWTTFARMPELRTSKEIPALESGNPLLSFKTWYCAKYSKEQYDDFDYIPTGSWVEYLAWFRQVLDIEVINEYDVGPIEWEEELDCFKIPQNNNNKNAFLANYVCLSTGMVASGEWKIPKEYINTIPQDRMHCAWDHIDFNKFKNKRVGVIGSGAAAFDNASKAIQYNCSQVTMFSRRVFPKAEGVTDILSKGRNDGEYFLDEKNDLPSDMQQAVINNSMYLDSKNRIKLLNLLFQDGRTAPRPKYLSRIKNIERINILEGQVIGKLNININNEIEITSNSETHVFDEILIATGPQQNISSRKELDNFHKNILLWGDVISEDMVLSLSNQPLLSESYQFQSNVPDKNHQLSKIYSMSDIVLSITGIQCVSKACQIISEDINKRLFKSSSKHLVEYINYSLY